MGAQESKSSVRYTATASAAQSPVSAAFARARADGQLPHQQKSSTDNKTTLPAVMVYQTDPDSQKFAFATQPIAAH